MTTAKTNDTMKKLAALYGLAQNYGKELPEQLTSLWLDLLAPYTAEQVAQAVARVVTEYEYKTLPPFAVLKKALDGNTGQTAEALDAMAAAEWQKVLAEIERVGSYGVPRGLHDTTLFVLRSMGAGTPPASGQRHGWTANGVILSPSGCRPTARPV